MEKAKVYNVGSLLSLGGEDTNKDLDIVLYILEMRYLTMDQIIRKFYEGGKVEKRVERLFDEGLIEVKDEALNLSSLVRVTSKGYEKAEEHFKDVIVPKKEKGSFPARINHDIMLTDLRIRFEELGFLKSWESETKLKEIPFFLRAFKDFPDAICKKKNDKCYFLELEVSKKGPKQYRERIDEYLEKLKEKEFLEAQVEGVIFFCVYPEVMEAIKKEIPKGSKGVSVQLYSKYFPGNESEENEKVLH